MRTQARPEVISSSGLKPSPDFALRGRRAEWPCLTSLPTAVNGVLLFAHQLLHLGHADVDESDGATPDQGASPFTAFIYKSSSGFSPSHQLERHAPVGARLDSEDMLTNESHARSRTQRACRSMVHAWLDSLVMLANESHA